jgi:hypothetical protein
VIVGLAVQRKMLYANLELREVRARLKQRPFSFRFLGRWITAITERWGCQKEMTLSSISLLTVQLTYRKKFTMDLWRDGHLHLYSTLKGQQHQLMLTLPIQ